MTKTILILAIAAAFVAGTITTTGLVYAHGGDITLIHACITKSSGSTRILLNPFDTCKSNEDPVHWSIVGPAGPTGATGPAGPIGDIKQGTDSMDVSFSDPFDGSTNGGDCPENMVMVGFTTHADVTFDVEIHCKALEIVP